MKPLLILLCSFIVTAHVFAQVQIPERIVFAGVELQLNSYARGEVSKTVESLSKYPKYFNQKVDRANMFFPIIERVFLEEGLPDDFKYLVLQESSLTSDAVSASNAVGFWQFKKESAQEVGLRIDGSLDERKNIVASSRGAAKYMKKNYVRLNNWIYTVQSYNTGYGGVLSSVKTEYVGASKMKIDESTHWYVLKLIAHKIAFENYLGKAAPSMTLVEYSNGNGQSLEEIARQADADPALVKEYNKWLFTTKIPDDRTYTVIIPTPASNVPDVVAKMGAHMSTPVIHGVTEHKHEPVITPEQLNSKDPIFITWNGLSAVYARKGDNAQELALQADIKLKKFLRYNDMHRYDMVKDGQIYYLEKKKSDATIIFHIVLPGESLFDIAQMYGIKIKSLKNKNRIGDGEAIQVGRKLYLKYDRPDGEAIIIEKPAPKKTVIITKDPAKKTELVKKTEPVKQIEIVKQPDPVIVKTSPVILDKSIKDSTKITAIKTSVTKASPIDTSQYLGHEVLQGQTLFGIAKQYGYKADSLQVWNAVLLAEGLKTGQYLQIRKPMPVTAEASDPNYIIHEVGAGESMYAIARKYNVAVPEILKANYKTDYSISAGQKLKIPRK